MSKKLCICWLVHREMCLCLTSGQYLWSRLTSHGRHHHNGNPGRHDHNHPSPWTDHTRCSLRHHGNSRWLRWTGEHPSESCTLNRYRLIASLCPRCSADVVMKPHWDDQYKRSLHVFSHSVDWFKSFSLALSLPDSVYLATCWLYPTLPKTPQWFGLVVFWWSNIWPSGARPHHLYWASTMRPRTLTQTQPVDMCTMSLSPSGGHHDTWHGLVPNGGGSRLQPRPGWHSSCHITGHVQRHSHRCAGW